MNSRLETMLAILAFALFIGTGFVIMHFVVKYW